MQTPTEPTDTVLIALRVDRGLLARLDAQAARINLAVKPSDARGKANRSSVIRAAVAAELARMERRR